MKSMTGYGRVRTENDLREITVEVRSVNHRYLDLSIKVPRVYAFLEDKIKTAVNAKLVRGKIDVYVSIRAKEGSDIRITPNLPVIEGYLNALGAIGERFSLSSVCSALEVARLPEALSAEKEEADADLLTREVMDAVGRALEEHNAMRVREGDKLCEDVLYRADLIEGLVGAVEARSPDSVSEYREKLAVRMTELLGSSDIAETRILSEAALFADKVSVTEEIVRLRSHLSQLRGMIAGSAAVGRKLDFLVQELNREANTVGSKANDYEIARNVVELKAEIEKIREQVQNLE